MHRTATEGYRVLVCAPYGRDAESVRELLARNAYDAHVCPTTAAVGGLLDERIGAVVVTEEALADGADALIEAVAAQPAWSDVPFLLLAAQRGPRGRASDIARSRLPAAIGNAIVLERPLSSYSLLSTIAWAMRARQKQFEMRDRVADLDRLARTLEERVAARTAERNMAASVMETTDTIVFVVGPGFRLLAANRAALDEYETMFGTRLAPGDDLLAPLAPMPEIEALTRDLWGRALAGEEFTVVREYELPSGDHPRTYEMTFKILRDEAGAQIGAFQLVTDITDRVRADAELKQVQEVLRQAQKMEALGQLTGGVAHDFNNLLTPIIGSLDLVQRHEALGERERRLLGGAMQSADRARTLVQRLLAFARRQPLQAGPVDLRALVGGMRDLIASTVGPTIELRTILSAALPAAEVDANQLEMAMLNLCVNARDAMPAGGTITIAAEQYVLATADDGLDPGRYIRLSVTDTGTGMDEETLRRATEPFFSTKGVGRGTGLGLSMVHGLALQLGGRMTVSSTVGEGTRIEMLVPESDRAPADEADPVPHALPATPGGRALVVDDEPLVRATTAAMLQALGHETVEAGGGAEALARIADGMAFDLVVTDFLMPEMSGVELAEAIAARVPDLPVLIVSGYAEAERIGRDMPRLAKPFQQEELAEAVARARGTGR